MSEADEDFEFQLQQEAIEAAAKESSEKKEGTITTNPSVYIDPNDGTEFEWDPMRKAWFPKINDDFIARYQASYGNYVDVNKEEKREDSKLNETISNQPEPDEFGKQTKSKPSTSSANQQDLIKRSQSEQKDSEWFEVNDEHNTNVYVSNLPMDITEEEFVELMKKCGLIMKDERNQLKIKLYRDETGMPKGDGRCCYIKIESVDLALNILDGYLFRDHTIKVERAKFSLKGTYDPTRKPKRKKNNKKDKEKQKKRMEKLFDWRPEKLPTERPKNEKVVVIKNMFDPKMFEDDPKLILEYRSDLREECEEKCGSVRKVEIYDLHPDGVATIAFNEFDDSDKCIELMNGRFFAGRKLDAQHWDGKTKFKMEESEKEVEKRIEQWEKFLEQE
ncbi:HIV Tat-specific factor 1 [Blomia tropicalis]|nr:HIV Tat-specific factor 1 [Blomia tropicalis]